MTSWAAPTVTSSSRSCWSPSGGRTSNPKTTHARSGPPWTAWPRPGELLDLEVAAAHGAGMSWAEIGRVVGITRQAARDRWGTTLGDDPARTDD